MSNLTPRLALSHGPQEGLECRSSHGAGDIAENKEAVLIPAIRQVQEAREVVRYLSSHWYLKPIKAGHFTQVQATQRLYGYEAFPRFQSIGRPDMSGC